MPLYEIAEDIRSDVSRDRPAWTAVAQGLLCFFWGLIFSSSGAAILLITPVLQATYAINQPSNGQQQWMLLQGQLAVGLGTALVIAGGMLFVFGLSLSCCSPHPGSRVMALVCLAIFVLGCVMMANSFFPSEFMGRALQRRDTTTQLFSRMIPVNVVSLFSQAAFVTFLYMLSMRFRQQVLTRGVYAYAIYQIVLAPVICLIFSWTGAISNYVDFADVGYAEIPFLMTIMQLAIVITLVLIGLVWLLRLILSIRRVIQTALRPAAPPPPPAAERPQVDGQF